MASFQKLAAVIVLFLSVSSHALFGADVDHLSVSSVGRNSKLVLKTDLVVPANKQDVGLRESSRGDGRVVSTCAINMRESSLDTRVLRASGEIVFTGQAVEGVDGTWQFHTLAVSQPEAIKSVTCYAEKMDINIKWHPTTAIIWDLKAAFSGTADLVIAGPVEIPSP